MNILFEIDMIHWWWKNIDLFLKTRDIANTCLKGLIYFIILTGSYAFIWNILCVVFIFSCFPPMRKQYVAPCSYKTHSRTHVIIRFFIFYCCLFYILSCISPLSIFWSNNSSTITKYIFVSNSYSKLMQLNHVFFLFIIMTHRYII